MKFKIIYFIFFILLKLRLLIILRLKSNSLKLKYPIIHDSSNKVFFKSHYKDKILMDFILKKFVCIMGNVVF